MVPGVTFNHQWYLVSNLTRARLCQCPTESSFHMTMDKHVHLSADNATAEICSVATLRHRITNIHSTSTEVLQMHDMQILTHMPVLFIYLFIYLFIVCQK